MLGDSLRSLLLGKSQEEGNLVLLQIMLAHHKTLQSSALETLNFLMLGREMKVLEHLTPMFLLQKTQMSLLHI